MRNLDTCENTSNQFELSEKIAFLQQYFTPEIRNFLNEANTQIFDFLVSTLVKMQRDVKSIENQDVFFFYEKNEVYQNFQDTYSHIKAIVVELLSNESWQSPSFDSTFIEQTGILQKVVVPFMNDYERFLPPVEYATLQLTEQITRLYGKPLYVRLFQSSKKAKLLEHFKKQKIEKKKNGETVFDWVMRLGGSAALCVEVSTYESFVELVEGIRKIEKIYDHVFEKLTIFLNIEDYFEGCAVVSNYEIPHDILVGNGMLANEKQMYSIALESKIEILSSLEYPESKTYQLGISSTCQNFFSQNRIHILKKSCEDIRKIQREETHNILEIFLKEHIHKEVQSIEEKINEIENQDYFFQSAQVNIFQEIHVKYKEILEIESRIRSLRKWAMFVEGYFENERQENYKKEILHMLQLKKNSEYKNILYMPEHVSFVTTSGMASANIITQFLKSEDVTLIENDNGYFEMNDILRGGKSYRKEEKEFSYSGNLSLEKLLAKEKIENNIAIFIEPTSNDKYGFTKFNVGRCIRFLEKKCPNTYQYYLIIDNTINGKEFQLSDILKNKKLPSNVQIIVFKSLQKYDSGYEDMCSGGLITVFGEENKTIGEKIEKIQKICGGSPSPDVLSQFHYLHNIHTEKERKISIENTKFLVEKIRKIANEFPDIFTNVVYDKKNAVNNLSPFMYVQFNIDTYSGPWNNSYNPMHKNPNCIFRVLPVNKRVEYFWALLFEECKKVGLQVTGGTSFGFKSLRMGKYSPSLRICPGIETKKELEVFCESIEIVCEKISKPIVFEDVLNTLKYPNIHTNLGIQSLYLNLHRKNSVNGQFIYRCFYFLELLTSMVHVTASSGIIAQDEKEQFHAFYQISAYLEDISENSSVDYINLLRKHKANMVYKLALVCKNIAEKITEKNYEEIVQFGKILKENSRKQERQNPDLFFIKSKLYEACINEIFEHESSYEAVKNIISKHIDAILDKIKG